MQVFFMHSLQNHRAGYSSKIQRGFSLKTFSSAFHQTLHRHNMYEHPQEVWLQETMKFFTKISKILKSNTMRKDILAFFT
ncbi:hypothetical protein AXF42_Ash017705 [Apostasia shenzhenica]|uniref:Uncharacterized protein n=1 Tax=Apostasia shenzhenica TaxID=1088818 RepID=A0A2I0B614_9ASPA|nr:hypothetical protein AXF42_Ash017705 [Apostasia shenzhenica]